MIIIVILVWSAGLAWVKYVGIGFVSSIVASNCVHGTIKNGKKIAEGSDLMSASWASMLSYHTCQNCMVLVIHTVKYCPCIVSRSYKLSLLSRLCFL